MQFRSTESLFSRDALSQLLLVSIATGADILEFVSETIEDHTAQTCNPILRYTIWGVWIWSLLQFGLVLTATDDGECFCCADFFRNADIWGVSATLLLQDIPFFAARAFFLFKLGIHSQMMWFFGIKNLLVVFLQIYRMIVLKKKVIAVILVAFGATITLLALFFDHLL